MEGGSVITVSDIAPLKSIAARSTDPFPVRVLSLLAMPQRKHAHRVDQQQPIVAGRQTVKPSWRRTERHESAPNVFDRKVRIAWTCWATIHDKTLTKIDASDPVQHCVVKFFGKVCRTGRTLHETSGKDASLGSNKYRKLPFSKNMEKRNLSIFGSKNQFCTCIDQRQGARS